MDITQYIKMQSANSKTGLQIAHSLWEKRKCSLQEAVSAFTEAGYWAEALPGRWKDDTLLLHVTDRPLVERDMTAGNLKKFGTRGIPFMRWLDSSKIVLDTSERSRFNPPELPEGFVEELNELMENGDQRREKFSGSFFWIAETGYPHKLWGLLDLTQLSELVIETEHDDYLDVIGFDEEGEILLATLETFVFESLERIDLIGNKEIKVVETATYESEIFVRGRISFSYPA